MALGAGAAATLAIPVVVRQPGRLLVFAVERGEVPLGSAYLWLKAAQPDVRNVSLVTPTWSRTQTNPVTWTLENLQPVGQSRRRALGHIRLTPSSSVGEY